ncbi:MAG: tyrosine-type recombinase/integrase [Thermoleophilia bacterium]|jgi:integrase|nr:tyrosine-type recombinase/integrase [Thermoleophilia bacterium]
MSRALVRTSTPGIYKRGQGYVVVFRDPTGRQRKRSAATLAEARALKATLNADVVRGEFREPVSPRFDEYAAQWIRTFRGRTTAGIRPTTLEEYRRDLDRYAIPFFRTAPIARIELRDMKAFAIHLEDHGLAPASVRKLMAPVRALFATALEEGLIRVNPCAGLRLAQRRPGALGSPRALAPEELAALIDATPPEWRLLVRFLAQTGLRIGEALALRWEHVDLGARRIRVRERVYRGTVDAPKSRYGVRDVPLATPLARELWRHRQESPFPGERDPVFASETGTPLRHDNLFPRVLKPAAVRAGVPWAGFHTLRHTCASMLFRSGWNAKQVQTVLGHHSPAFTLATYVHLIPEDLPEPVFPEEVMGRRDDEPDSDQAGEG